ncbi:MAG: winged helix-turn-helix transcriptional regulator [Actinomycetia bacterium]|nr:winged helix-turn-helix transcriptional regulator [Actinomycetes bacterium]
MTSTDNRPWTFLTNHARVLVMISSDPEIRLRDLSATIGITERSAQRIVAELEEGGYLTHEKVGRRNRYEVSLGVGLRHPHEQDVEVGMLLALFSDAGIDS